MLLPRDESVAIDIDPAEVLAQTHGKLVPGQPPVLVRVHQLKLAERPRRLLRWSLLGQDRQAGEGDEGKKAQLVHGRV